MLIEFSIENFLSFKDKVTFTMEASSDKKLEDNYVNIENEKILKSTAIYGANASGKSNLFKALAIVNSMIVQSNFIDPNSNLPIIPFKLNKKNINEPSSFEIKFIFNNIKYLYGFKADSKVIYNEYLYYYPKGKQAKIFVRDNVDKYTFNVEDNKILNDIKGKNTANKFFLSTATTWNFDKTKPAYDFLTQKIGVVFSIDQVNNYSYKMYSTDTNGELEKLALKFLKKADFNITGYKVNEERMTEETLNLLPDPVKPLFSVGATTYKISTKHNIENEEFEFNIGEESVGTQNIFSLIPVIRDVLVNGKVLIIDEIDRSLHPLLVKYILEIFNDEEINKNGSQLIFNTHDTNILDLELLRRDQIWFTEKNPVNGASNIYPLDDFSVRNTENIEKGYLLGRYGAVPFIDENINPFEK